MGDYLRAAVIGLGSRGCGLLTTIHSIHDLKIVAVCDIMEDRLQKGIKILNDLGDTPDGYLDYRRIIDRGDIDLVYVITNWITHWEICIDFMKAGIYTAAEVCGATSLDECWELVHTYERTGTPMMLLENCCYGRTELAALNMLRQGLFGRVVYTECGYCHDLRSHICDMTHARCNQNFMRNGDLYPTHGALPMGKLLNINRGNRFVSIASMSTPAYGVQDYLQRNQPDHPLADARCKQYACGDVTTSILKCAGGELMMIRHNIALPRPYSRANLVQGTQGVLSEDCKGVHLDGVHKHEEWEPLEEVYKKYDHPLWQNYDPSANDGHGGMDYLVMDAFAEAARTKTLPPIDVYDAATYMAITTLSEDSVAMGGMPQAFPDFTRGKWTMKRPLCPTKYNLDTDEVF
ncbi:MAG: gfo/Idh/MocA family oxidoreductase [Clostridiales bacterium]|nr:gfo/Idh/MocA family oxidoreductase [Clostridiales bacterium]